MGKVSLLRLDDSAIGGASGGSPIPEVYDSWLQYCATLASQGYCVGLYAPNADTVDNLQEFLQLFTSPIKYFGNLRFLFEWKDGYRGYQIVYNGVRASCNTVIGLDPEDYVVFVGRVLDGEVDVSVGSRCSKSEEDIQAVFDVIFPRDGYDIDPSEFLEVIEENFCYVSPSCVWGFNAMAPECSNDRYNISFDQLQSLRGMPLYKSSCGQIFDCLRGTWDAALGSVAAPWIAIRKDEVLSSVSWCEFGNRTWFLRIPAIFREYLEDYVSELYCDFLEHDGVCYCMLRGDGDYSDSTAVAVACISAAYNAPASSLDLPGVYILDEAGVDEHLKYFKQAGLSVMQTGPYEFNISIGSKAIAGGYVPE